MMRLRLVLALLLAASGCARYRDFTLPPVGAAENVRWEWHAHPTPVLTRGDWDSVDVLNPSVISYQGQLWNFYSGFDGRSWHTGLAISVDGLNWERRGKILSATEGEYIAANGAAIVQGTEVFYYYQSGRTARIALARSPNGRTFGADSQPVLEPGPYGSWDERGVADPYVIRQQGRLYLYYNGMDRARRQRLGVAVSDDGLIWSKLRTNPILEIGEYGAFDAHGLGEPAVWAAYGFYWMLYTGRGQDEVRRLGLARSSDGVQWKKQPSIIAGAEAWDAKVICDPTVIAEPDRVRVWFGGGDIARPDENLHGQIGYAELLPQRIQ
jgi:predicted GH43/DUF377 family glycosyl hydrolase